MQHLFILFLLLAISNDLNAQTPPAAAFAPPPGPTSSAPAPATPSGPSLLGKDGGQQIDITADQSLEWNETERVYIARGNAKAVRGEATIEADILKAYDRKKPDGTSEVWKMEAEGNVKLSSKNSTATGDAAVYDIDTKKAILTGKNLTFNTDKDKVTAEKSLEYWENEQKAFAIGNATATRDGRQLRADQLVANIKKDAKGAQNIDTMEAKGGVHIVTAEDVVFCDSVLYNLTANTAVLQGNVNITRGTNQLKGDRVEADFKSGKSRLINNGRGRVHALITSVKDAKPANADAAPKGTSQNIFIKP